MSVDRSALYAQAANYLDQLTALADRERVDRDLMLVMVGIVGDCLESLQDAEVSLGDAYPALLRWRDWTIAHQRTQSPLAVAAAWEVSALEHLSNGEYDRASHALASAHTQPSRAA